MEKLTEKAIFVIANYKFGNANYFCDELEKSESYKTYLADFKKIPIKSNPPLPENFPMPLALYRNNGGNEFIYSVGDARLDISINDYSNNKDLPANWLFILAQFKLQDISAIGINFNANCKTSDRLSIFNEKINDETITNWSKNTGFTLTIPILIDESNNCTATYKITKIQGGKDKDLNITEQYVYNISVNYNFIINEDKADTMKRYEKLKTISNKINELYSDFNNKCNEFTRL